MCWGAEHVLLQLTISERDGSIQTVVRVTEKKEKRTKKLRERIIRGANLNENVIFNRRSDIPAESKGEVGVSPAKSRGDYSRELCYFTLLFSMEFQYFRELEKLGNCISKDSL